MTIRLHGITVNLIQKIKTGEDPFGSPIYSESVIPVENVLVAPSSSDDIVDSQNLYGKKAIYTLGIPKGDKNNWKDTEVRFFGKAFRTFGEPTEGIDDLIPLEWNKKVKVEVIE